MQIKFDQNDCRAILPEKVFDAHPKGGVKIVIAFDKWLYQ
jgi:hypothetical protein